MDELDRDVAARVRDAYRGSPPPDAAARARLIGRLQALEPPGRWRAGLGWLVRPRLVLSPLAGAAAALALLSLGGALVLAIRGDSPRVPAPPAIRALAPSGNGSRAVQFVLVAPQASRVALVGDFNGWDPQALPMTRAGDSWTLTVPVPHGRHVYAFVLDGDRWVSDPAAPIAPEDEFGFRKSVVVVGGSEPT